MNKFLRHFVLTVLVSCVCTIQAQQSKFTMSDPNENFYTTQKKLNKYFKKHEKKMAREREEQANGKGKIGDTEEEELGGYELFKRWEEFMEPRVYPSGDKSMAFRAYEEYKSYQLQNSQQKNQNPNILSSTWLPLGPFGDPTGGNAGRVNAVRFDPVNPTGIWACTPDGGLWSTANNGSTWTTNTDFLAPIGNSDVCFDPTNAQNMYMATGDGDANDSYSIGVLKSTDGGGTWNPTGLVWTTSQSRRIYKMIINPLNKNVIFIASNIGVYRTTNGGTSWASVSTGAYTDIEYKPGDTTIVYAVSTSLWGGTTTFYKSINGGSTFSATATGLPASANCDRFAIAVTPNNSAYVYLVASSAANDGFYGCYQSVNSGAAFSSRSTTPNLLGWASAGNDVGGQGWYTLSIAASPTNANEIVVGGVNTWRSINGGTNWTLFTHWTGSGAPFVHADCHDLVYKNGTTIYNGGDGGVFYTSNSGATWFAVNGAMNIAQMYKMGNSKTTYARAIAGHQDNGTNFYTGGWSRTLGGDGMQCFIDWNNDNVMYGEQYNGSFNRTTNGGTNWSAITTGITGTAAWNTPWHQDPLTANTLYGGRQRMFKSTNQGTGWTGLAVFPTGTASIREFAVAPSNVQVIYVLQGGTVLFKTTNGGTSWTNITGTLPVGSAQMTNVAVEDNDPNSVWVTFSGYSSGNKVYKSTDGGTTWVNYSTGLPNIPTNCITYWNGTQDGLYIGCDVGIYYRDSLQASWVIYNTGLPNVSIRDIAIFYPTGKVRAATYGRGMWEADLFNNGALPPFANFVADKTFICAGMTVNFTDQSSFAPTSWSWVFQGGTPSTSTAQNPSVVYNTPGTYSVSLTATNVNGNNTMTKTLYITVSPINALPLVEGFQGTFAPANWQNYDAGTDNLIWAKSSTVGKASTASMFYDNYNLDAAGKRDEMRTPKYNFAGFATIKLYFDVAYAQYDAIYSDTLAIMVSSDCGLTFTQVYVKGGTTLATAPNITASVFIPTAAQWRTDTVYLNAYAGQGNVMVAFQNRGRFGQALYVDNVNIAGSGVGAPPNAVFSSAATKCTGQNILFTDASTNVPTSWSWTFSGGVPATSTAQNPTVTFATAGTKTVTLIASNGFGNSTPTTQTITVVATPTVTASPASSTICSGTSAILTGATATTYTWSANAGSATTNTVSVSPTSLTVYTVTGANGSCSSTGTATITVNATPTITAVAGTPTICTGQSTTLTGGGATNYTWTPGGATTSTVSVSPGGNQTYTLTGVTGGCSATRTVAVTVNITPTVTAVASTPTICSGQSTTLTGGGATNYTWNPGGATTSTVSVSPGGNQTYTVTGATGTCSATRTVAVTVNSSPTVTVNSPAICAGSSTVLTAGGATTYSWSTSATTNTISVSPAGTTTYVVTGTSAGCSATITSTVNVTPIPTIAVNNGAVCNGGGTTLIASGATTYSWSPATGLSSTTGSLVASFPSSTIVYTVTGTTSGCAGVKTSTVTVTPNPTVTVNSPSICSGNSVILTASGGTTYSWSTSATTNTISVSPGGTTTYTVTGTTSGCTNAVVSTVNVSPTPTVNVNSSTICSGSPTTLTASGATTYSWSPGTGLSATTGSSVTANPGSTQVYTITGTTGSCSSSSTSTVTVVASLTVIVNSPSICAGQLVTLTASGASTYSWSTGGSTSSINVSPGTTTVYTVTGTSGSCNASNTSTVSVTSLPVVTANTSSVTICSGQSTMLTGGGATTYTWSANAGSATTNTVSVSPSVNDTYTVTGTALGCNNTATVSVAVNPTPTITVNSAGICNGNSTTLTSSGATTYSWSPGTGLSATSGASVNANPTSTIVYTITGTSTGCTGTNTSTVTVNPTPTVTASSGTSCAGTSTNLNAGGATTYTWNPGGLTGSSVVVTPTVTTTYTVTGDNGGCTGNATSTVTINSLPGISATAVSDTFCIGGSTSMSASGGVSYAWSPGTGLSATTGANVTCSTTVTTTYTITGTDVNGCINTTTQLITVNGCSGITQPAVNNNMVLVLYPNPSNGTFLLSIPSGNATVYNIEIRNALSQLVYTDKIQANGNSIQKTITIPEVKSGVYTFFIWNGENKLVKKVVVE